MQNRYSEIKHELNLHSPSDIQIHSTCVLSTNRKDHKNTLIKSRQLQLVELHLSQCRLKQSREHLTYKSQFQDKMRADMLEQVDC